jgi:DNA mismatch repair protein MutS
MGAVKPPLTPMLEQYQRARREHPDAILMFRLGDFYEMFYEDAQVAARVLDIALTSRGRGTDHEAPMCGVPYHAASSYVARLVRAGHRVALCDQVEEAGAARGLVRREVIRVVSPGTLTDPGALDAGANNWIAALCRGRDAIGAAYADLSTGDLRAAEAPLDRAPEAIALHFAAFRPREVLLPEEAAADLLPSSADGGPPWTVSRAPAWSFGDEASFETLIAHFGTASLAGFGFEQKGPATRAAGALLRHLKETQRSDLSHVTRLRPYLPSEHLILDATTLRTLEVAASLREGKREGTLLAVLDRTITPMGARLLRTWLVAPSACREVVEARHEAVAELLVRPAERAEIRGILSGICDVERILGRLAVGTATPRDLVALRDSLAALPRLAEVRRRLAAPLLGLATGAGDVLSDVEGLIRAAIADEPAADPADGGVVRDGYRADLDDLRSVSRDGRSYIAGIESRERSRTGIGSLKVRYNKVFGYYIEVSRPNLPLVPADYERKQTLVGAERFVTAELKDYEEKVLTAQERIGRLESEIFVEIRSRVAAAAVRIRAAAEDAARLDVLASFAEVAASERFTRPRMLDAGRLRIRGGRHPVVEAVSAERFVPNDLDVGGDGARILIITGPNMGGKSTYLRQAALITLMAHAGSFVPASEAEIPIVDRIFSRVGASDHLASGQSTFMVEMTETANILNNATPASLVLLDEVGRGTATFDGLSLAWAIVEHVHDGPRPAPMTLFATHYHELTDLALTLPRVSNLTMAVKEGPDGVVFLRRVVEGSSDRSYGIQVAKLAGLPAGIIDRAREILSNLEVDEVGRDGMPRLARHRDPGRPPEAQLSLFGPPADPREEEVVAEIRALDPDALTPLKALEILHGMKERLRG